MAGSTSDGQGGKTCKQGDKKCYDDVFKSEAGQPSIANVLSGAEIAVKPVSPHDSPTAPSSPTIEREKGQGMGV